ALTPPDQFTYFATIAGVSPNGGPTTGGTSVTITGAGFAGATAVQFGSTNATTFTVNSDTQITAISPSGSAGAVDVRVTIAGNSISPIVLADRFTYVAVPGVSSVTPSVGPALGGTTVIITGSNFTGATAVQFGAANALSFTVNSANQITAVSPAGAGAV